jgi:hypothetical protein
MGERERKRSCPAVSQISNLMTLSSAQGEKTAVSQGCERGREEKEVGVKVPSPHDDKDQGG